MVYSNRQGYFKAVIKLDNTKTTGSTGGIVTDVFFYFTDLAEGVENPLPYNTKDKSYISIRCTADCKPGWIYKDKENYLYNPNI